MILLLVKFLWVNDINQVKKKITKNFVSHEPIADVAQNHITWIHICDLKQPRKLMKWEGVAEFEEKCNSGFNVIYLEYLNEV